MTSLKGTFHMFFIPSFTNDLYFVICFTLLTSSTSTAIGNGAKVEFHSTSFGPFSFKGRLASGKCLKREGGHFQPKQFHCIFTYFGVFFLSGNSFIFPMADVARFIMITNTNSFDVVDYLQL